MKSILRILSSKEQCRFLLSHVMRKQGGSRSDSRHTRAARIRDASGLYPGKATHRVFLIKLLPTF